jgi:2-polyprenyl-3-methyl-5-hydroxy-6-metoxy-1,4-benzoquinol methylase
LFVNTRYRSTEEEIMDDLSMEGEMLRKTLDKVAAINKRLGGNQATIDGINTLLKTKPGNAVITVVDIGCGNGDMLRAVAAFGRKNNFIFKLTGVDANEYTVNYARKLSAAYPEISYAKMDVLSDEFSALKFDIALATLFLHHFKNEEIETLLTGLVKQTTTGIVINDLHRCKMAYYLFRMISIFIKNPMVRNDGAVSVLRGFKKTELIEISKKIENTIHNISWKWAFRYQWIIKKL